MMKKQFSRTKNSIVNIFTSFGSQLLITALKFITRTVFIHTLGKSYLGINGLFTNILQMLSLTELGFDMALNFQLYKPLAIHDDKRVRVLLKFYKQAYNIIGSIIFVLGLCLIPLLPVLIKDYDSLAALGINATLLFILFLLQSTSSYLFFAYRSVVMKANQKKYILDIYDSIITVLMNVVQILILVLYQNFILYTTTVIVFNILRNIINAIIAKRYYPHFFVKEPDSLSKQEIIDLFKDCGALFVFKMNGVVLKATDNIVLSFFLGLGPVGIYSNYLLFFNTIKSFLYHFYNAVKASMGNLYTTGDIKKMYRIFEVMNFLAVILYGTAAIGISVCANELILCWVGSDYIIAQPFPILIGIEIFFHGLLNNLAQVRSVSGVFRQMWYRPIIGVLVNIVASVILVQFIGIYGVILGTILSYLSSNFAFDPILLYKYVFNNYRSAFDYYKKNIIYMLVLCVICIICSILCNYILPNGKWISVIVHIIIVSVSVPCFMLLFFWRTHECRYVIDIIKGIVIKLLNKKITIL